MTTHTQSTTEHNHILCNKPSVYTSLDVGVYVEFSMDESLPTKKLDDDHKEDPKISQHTVRQNNNRKLSERDLEEQYETYAVMSGPNPGSGTAGTLKVPTKNIKKALMPPSSVAVPPPLPPKRRQRSPALSPELKTSNSLGCQTSPGLDAAKGNNPHSDIGHNSLTFGKCASPQPPQRSAAKAPVKPPRLNKPKWIKTERGEQTRDTGDKGNQQEQQLTGNKKTEGNEETSGMESQLDVGKTQQEILVIFTEVEKDGNEGDDTGNEASTMTENPFLSSPNEKSDMATNINYTSADSTKPEPRIPPQVPPKLHGKYPAQKHIRSPQLRRSTEYKEEKQKRQQEDEQWSRVLDEGRDENDRGMVSGNPRDTELTPFAPETVMESIPKPLPPPPLCKNSRTPLLTTDRQTPHHQAHHPQQQSKANGQFNHGPLPQDPKMETMKWTEKDNGIHMPGQGKQDFKVIFNFPPGHQEGTEVLELSKLQDGGQNQKSTAGVRVMKMIHKLKEGKDERRKIKAGGMETDGEDNVYMTQDDRRQGEERGMKTEEEEEDRLTEIQSHTKGTERRIIRRHNATSKSIFGSFKLCSPVNLVEELLSGEEWSQFLHRDQSSTPEPLPAGQQSGSPCSCADLDLNLDVFEDECDVPVEEHIYEDVEFTVSHVTTEEMDRTSSTNIPKIVLDGDTYVMSPRTKDIFNTVKFLQPANILPEVKPQAVLDTSVQKYLIKLSKKRKHRRPRKWQREKKHETPSQSLFSTSPQEVYTASVFYNMPAAGGDDVQQPYTVKSGRSSPRTLAKLKTALKDKTLLRAGK